MSPFMGGSAVAMAGQVADGYTLVTAVQLKRLTDPEMDQLLFELERILRDLRGTVIPLEDVAAIQTKNRKLARINGAVQQIQATRAQRRRRM
ncbi:MAG: hypothetical protein KA072_10250 [Thermoanaerobaculaceae bacterium]|nr:hypothetical protein [Thermoanaerobaculaceae bacterium]MDI9621106.1 hypothetical protein [Acidobacteriota bacterium]NLH09926.1 hypothetical protein [Holophagae bacterium]HPW55541.1 hypothetical protein [Thermoanaerobaculaceae bacterium]